MNTSNLKKTTFFIKILQFVNIPATISYILPSYKNCSNFFHISHSYHFISISWTFSLISRWSLNIVNFFWEHPTPISEWQIYPDKSLYSIQGITKWFPSSIITDVYKEIWTDMSKLELSLQFKLLRVNTNAEMQKSRYPGNQGNRMFKL